MAGRAEGLEQGRSAVSKELVMKMLAAGIAVERAAMLATFA